MKIANLSTTTDSKTRKELRKKEPNRYISAYCTPTKEVIKYFDLDIELLES